MKKPGKITFLDGDPLAATERTTSLELRMTKAHLADDLYELLEPAYRAAADSWIDLPGETTSAYPSTPGVELPLHLRRLLPISDGWTFHPRFRKPERPDYMLTEARICLLHCPWFSSAATQDDKTFLLSLEGRILHRAEKHGMVHRSEKLLESAVSDAEDQLKRVLKLPANGLPWLIDTWAERDPERKRSRQQAEETLQTQIRLMNLRVHWLKTWLDVERDKKADRPKERATSVAKDNLALLIKPDDLRQVVDFFDALEADRREALPSGKNASQAAGLWYTFILRRCGATWREFRRLRKANKSIVRKHAEAKSSRERVEMRWGDIVYHKASAKKAYIHRSEPAFSRAEE